MLKLTRAVRITEIVELPNGETLEIDCNVEAQLPTMLNRFAIASSAATAAKEHTTDETQAAFYTAYADFLKAVMGADNWSKFCDAFDANLDEICEAMSEWVNGTVVPAMAEASKRNMNRRKRGLK